MRSLTHWSLAAFLLVSIAASVHASEHITHYADHSSCVYCPLLDVVEAPLQLPPDSVCYRPHYIEPSTELVPRTTAGANARGPPQTLIR
ncbi:MAG: hypothetical protein OIF35_10060 [Cellvibrionaceae bacterium]|nr:hypothetical protein [Cellvibrionaceae bacterium]MCV6627757.1 hypothetical protein [Cellvibrionaceae bacterium]